MSYNDVHQKARRVVLLYRGLATGDLRAYITELDQALRATDPLELENLIAQNEALKNALDEQDKEIQNLTAGLARLSGQVETLRESEARLKAERAAALEEADDLREHLEVVRKRLRQIAQKQGIPVEAWAAQGVTQ